MYDSISVFAKFVCGLSAYDEFQVELLSERFSKELLKDMPLSIRGCLVAGADQDVFDQLKERDSLRQWGDNSEALKHQISKYKCFVFDCVKHKVNVAFCEVAVGDRMTLAQAQAIDGYQSVRNQLLARNKDKDFTWKNYPVQQLEGLTALLHLDGEAFSYYIPLYLCWCIDNCLSDPFSDVASETFGAFDCELSGFDMRFNSLTPLQQEVVADFLWLFAIYSNFFRESCVASLSGMGKSDFVDRKINCPSNSME